MLWVDGMREMIGESVCPIWRDEVKADAGVGRRGRS